ncbi:hypothetical protein ANCCAN_22006 [Ancylostoma caninum]|uniref:C2H2-type domain-containing protein n=1 Tax=Ancylostoma caninum TaxID=29170 RepID=A0A368FJ83_ANCCA|nr:hypothetical protein ANCCAN_22006 [Ancylostoma caninum]
MPKPEGTHHCTLCKMSFMSFDTVIRHLRRGHGGAGRMEAERLYSLQHRSNDHINVECPECNAKFKKDHIGQHVTCAHNYTDDERQSFLKRMGCEKPVEGEQMPFKCDHCASSFWTKRELNEHLDQEHPNGEKPSTSSPVNGLVCAVEGCSSVSGTHEELVAHCTATHKEATKQQFGIFAKYFENVDDFFEWKSDIEEETCTSFRLKPNNNANMAEYECHRAPSSSSSDPSSTKKLYAKPCSAFINCRMRKDGSIEAIGCTDHIGHAKEPQKLLLTLRQREEVRGLISKGVSAEEIIEQMKTKYDKQSRLHFLTSTDVALLDDNAVGEAPKVDEHVCPECGEGPMPLAKLRDHTSEVHRNISKLRQVEQDNQRERPSNYDIYYYCDFCLFSCFTHSVLESHLQTYHARNRSEYEPKLPTPTPVDCPKCGISFRTRYLLAVHCVGVHTTAMTDFSLVQISFDSWTQFEPWRTTMERDTQTVLVKSGMQAWNTKLIHSYHCQFDQTVVTSTQDEKEDKKPMNCPAFIQVMENEDGVLDCVACFGHLGHEMDGLPPEPKNENAEMKRDEENPKDKVEPCFLCGHFLPPEIDAEVCEEVEWCCCSNSECHLLAHEWCTRLFGKQCPECERGVLVGEPLELGGM